METSFELAAGSQAFGDGAHPTTRGVLAAIGAIEVGAFTPRMACDMGAGSGILSMAVARKFQCPVVAVDIARTAVETIVANAQHNGIASGIIEREASILAVQADGFTHPDIAAHAPFDLITANMLAEPLLTLAREMERYLTPGGVLILGGILNWQESQIRDAYAALGLELSGRLSVGDWITLCWGKPHLS